MNSRIAKLLKKHCHLSGKDYSNIKKWYNGLGDRQKENATANIRKFNDNWQKASKMGIVPEKAGAK